MREMADTRISVMWLCMLEMYDPIVGIDVLDNWDEITSVVNR